MRYFLNFFNKKKIGILFYALIITYTTSIGAQAVWRTHIGENTAYIYLSGEKRRGLVKPARNPSQHALEQAIQNGQFAFILAKCQELSLPFELALIPLIESHYTLQAVSQKGAAGLWQIMPATSHAFGLPLVDRFKLRSSTWLALNYFKALHEEFGNWELAICAYNAGSHRVKSALKIPASIDELYLPKETLAYLQKFRALQKAFNGDVR